MSPSIQIVYAFCAALAIGGALPGCVVDDESPCLPAGLVKHGCNDPLAAPACPASQVCRAAWTCVPVGCVETGPCAARRDTARLSFYAGTDDYASEHAFTAKAAYLTDGYTRSLQLHDESAADGVTYGVSWRLPPGSSVPIAEGDTVKVEGCRAGMGPNPRWVVVLRDAADKLLLAGGEGMFVADSPCLQRLLTIRRRELGCHLYADTAMDKFSPPYMENYALELVDDLQSQVLGMNEEASLTLAGQKLTAIVIDARYPTEWAATDVNAPHDGLVIVAEKTP